MSDVAKNRPVFRNIHITEILRYRMPLAAITSILHRISGFLMFLLLPFILYLFEQSITSESTFEYFKGIVSGWFAKLVLLALIWAYLHHFCAGIRHIVLETQHAGDKITARKTAATVLVISLGLTFVLGLKLFGVF